MNDFDWSYALFILGTIILVIFIGWLFYMIGFVWGPEHTAEQEKNVSNMELIGITKAIII